LCGEKLLIGILSPKTAAVQYDLLTFDIIAKPESAQSQPILVFPVRDIGQLLDRITASSVIRICLKEDTDLFVPGGKFLRLFSSDLASRSKWGCCADGESRRHTFWRRLLPPRFSMLRSLSSSALSSAKSSSAGRLLPARYSLRLISISRFTFGSCSSR
jgi:hypothetical protein